MRTLIYVVLFILNVHNFSHADSLTQRLAEQNEPITNPIGSFLEGYQAGQQIKNMQIQRQRQEKENELLDLEIEKKKKAIQEAEELNSRLEEANAQFDKCEKKCQIISKKSRNKLNACIKKCEDAVNF